MILIVACSDSTAPASPTCAPAAVVDPRTFRQYVKDASGATVDSSTVANRYTRPLRNADTITGTNPNVGTVRIITWKSNNGCQTLYDSLLHRMGVVRRLP